MDSRNVKHTYDINKVDFNFVEKTESVKELTKAYKAIKEDGGFHDLQRALEEKLKTLDPAFKRRIEDTKLTYDE